ncbi:hypothetical protein BaRGS_00004062 [Batillaria attramentaria]|uniref:Uncharacterized protein n=1 Tax=Batillaria attramentaria TaxID=370345 RepID=A0ABD0LZ94_9CAEN
MMAGAMMSNMLYGGGMFGGGCGGYGGYGGYGRYGGYGGMGGMGGMGLGQRWSSGSLGGGVPLKSPDRKKGRKKSTTQFKELRKGECVTETGVHRSPESIPLEKHSRNWGTGPGKENASLRLGAKQF